MWFATSRTQSVQYQNTDLIYDYQNLILHELLVRDWVNGFENNPNFEETIEADLSSDFNNLIFRFDNLIS